MRSSIHVQILDLNQNRVESVKDIRHLQNLTDFWAKGNKASRFSIIIACKGRNAHLKIRKSNTSFHFIHQNLVNVCK